MWGVGGTEERSEWLEHKEKGEKGGVVKLKRRVMASPCRVFKAS